MNAESDPPPIPEALKQYVRDPLPEEFTVEIFEDWHAVLDAHLVELARQRGSSAKDQAVVDEWNAAHAAAIEERRIRIRDKFGALLPFDFIAGNVKMEYLVGNGHPEYGSNHVADDVVEVMQEFLEIITYRDELER